MAETKDDFICLQVPADGTGRRHKGKAENPCKGCFYCGGKTEYVKSCNYYLITGKRRPCEAGEGCTVKLDSMKARRKPLKVSNS